MRRLIALEVIGAGGETHGSRDASQPIWLWAGSHGDVYYLMTTIRRTWPSSVARRSHPV